jgi:molybdate transport system substrate-binding protein
MILCIAKFLPHLLQVSGEWEIMTPELGSANEKTWAMRVAGRRDACGRIFAFLILCVLIITLSGCHDNGRVSLTISAAASLQETLEEVETLYRFGHTMVDFRNNFGSSGTLAREIEEGAPVDAFISAAAKPMDDLEGKGLIVTGTRANLLHNSLVLIAPLDSKLQGFAGLAAGSTRLIAVGDPASVPAGQYAQQTLNALHLYDQVKGKLVLGKDVRQVLTYVETGNADAGFVYATDAQISQLVRVVAIAPESAHDPIVYPAAVVRASENQEEARSFVKFLGTSEAKEIFTKHGYTLASQ